MKLTTKGRYAARAMLELTKNTTGNPLQLKEIAQRQDISVKYLERIMTKMASAGLVSSLRGLHGGFTLAKTPEEIKLLDILTAADESIIPVDCVVKEGRCGNETTCVMNRVWSGLYINIKNYLTSISLKDLMTMELENL
ncbi:RrF2 family transcriptional regulator [bacterium]|nr:RrF2 family transcriptional regulator [bacterium]